VPGRMYAQMPASESYVSLRLLAGCSAAPYPRAKQTSSRGLQRSRVTSILLLSHYANQAPSRRMACPVESREADDRKMFLWSSKLLGDPNGTVSRRLWIDRDIKVFAANYVDILFVAGVRRCCERAPSPTSDLQSGGNGKNPVSNCEPVPTVQSRRPR
jgi:hypothetical protein